MAICSIGLGVISISDVNTGWCKLSVSVKMSFRTSVDIPEKNKNYVFDM